MKSRVFITLSTFSCIALLVVSSAAGEDALIEPSICKLETEFESSMKGGSSNAGQRLALQRLARDAKMAIAQNDGKPARWALLELLFRVQKHLIKIDDSEKIRKAVLETCRELVKAPNEQAHLAFEADLLLSQVELAKKGVGGLERTAALRPFVNRYVETKKGAEALKVAMVMALESGDAGLVDDLREMMAIHSSADP